MATAKVTGHSLIAHQGIGDSFEGIYYVESCYIKLTVHGKEYMDMMLRDKSGSRPVKYWGKLDGIKKGMFVFVACMVEDYQGKPSIIAKNMEEEETPDDLGDYIPIYDDSEAHAKRFDELRAELKALEEKTKDVTCGILVDEVFRSGQFFSRFIQAPGSAGPHYGRQGGLLAATIRVADAAYRTADLYSLNEGEKSVMIAASLICRIGAVDAFEFKDCMPAESTQGILIGISNLTVTRVHSAVRRAAQQAQEQKQEINRDVVMKVLHAVVASNGSCGIVPMTKEAMILTSVMRSDAEIVDSIDFIANDLNVTEEFTAFDPVRRRRYYVGQRNDD